MATEFDEVSALRDEARRRLSEIEVDIRTEENETREVATQLNAIPEEIRALQIDLTRARGLEQDAWKRLMLATQFAGEKVAIVSEGMLAKASDATLGRELDAALETYWEASETVSELEDKARKNSKTAARAG